jgi:ABC-type multidrug transport system ATPase subunit
MTTHFMEEADRLGDRIAIMTRGKKRGEGEKEKGRRRRKRKRKRRRRKEKEKETRNKYWRKDVEMGRGE